ncbi:MAG: NAD(P)H-hydrate epimerase [Planctomycetota bacterium]
MLSLTRAQARAIDRYAIHELGYPGPVLMENAGRGCVDVMDCLGAEAPLPDRPIVRVPVVIVAGKGNNAGDGFVIARHLALRGHEVRVALGAAPHTLSGDALTAFGMLTPCRVTILDLTGVHAGEMLAELDGLSAGLADPGQLDSGETAAWIVDALLGTGAEGAPRPPFDALIDWINAERATDPRKRVLAIDLPSGLDAGTGEASPTTVRADHTCTFVAPKVGFQNPAAAEWLGEVHTVEIGLPSGVIAAALG